MRMKSKFIAIALVMSITGLSQAAEVSYTVADIDALVVNSTFTNFTTANLIAGNNIDVATGVGTSALTGTAWSWPNDMSRRDAGSANNNRWIQTGNSEIWDLGQAYSSVVVGNDYDHGRNSSSKAEVYLEALEWTAWGSNDQNATFNGTVAGSTGWELGTLTAVYAQGWDAVNAFEDFLGQVSFSSAYRYIHVIAQNSISIGGRTSFDNEIDFVGGVNAVPIPAAAFMFAPALLGFLGLRRRTRI